MARRKVRGYIWNEQVMAAVRANKAARRALGQMLDENPGPARRSLLLALIARYLGEGLGALMELQEIIQKGDSNDG